MAVDPQVGSSDRDAETMEELLGDRSAGVLSLLDASGGGTDVAVGDRVVASSLGAGRGAAAPGPARGAVAPARRGAGASVAPRSDATRGSNRRLFIVPARACVCAHHGLSQGAGSQLLIYISSPRRIVGVPSTSASFAPRQIETPSELVHSGDLVRVRVVAIDPERRRLSLSLRQAAGNVVYATRTDQDANV